MRSAAGEVIILIQSQICEEENSWSGELRPWSHVPRHSGSSSFPPFVPHCFHSSGWWDSTPMHRPRFKAPRRAAAAWLWSSAKRTVLMRPLQRRSKPLGLTYATARLKYTHLTVCYGGVHTYGWSTQMLASIIRSESDVCFFCVRKKHI